MNTEYTPGPWKPAGPLATHILDSTGRMIADAPHPNGMPSSEGYANRDLIAAAPDLLEALKIARLAIGEHHAPHDCYATGPLTGNHYLDLVACPACAFIKMHDAAIAKAEGGAE